MHRAIDDQLTAKHLQYAKDHTRSDHGDVAQMELRYQKVDGMLIQGQA